MLIPGVPDEDLARQHWREGGGRGTLGYRHLPSGISVSRQCPPGVPVAVVDAELLAELAERLRDEWAGAGRGVGGLTGWTYVVVRSDGAGPPTSLARRQMVRKSSTPSPLLAARRHHRQHPLDEPAPRFAVGPAADPPPDHGVPQGSLGRVVRRLDALDPREGPQAIPEPQQLGAGRRRLRAGARRPALQARTDHRPQPGHGLEPPQITRC